MDSLEASVDFLAVMAVAVSLVGAPPADSQAAEHTVAAGPAVVQAGTNKPTRN
jgi:hypothetical protein